MSTTVVDCPTPARCELNPCHGACKISIYAPAPVPGSGGAQIPLEGIERAAVARDFLDEAERILLARAKEYDKPGGERSVAAVVAACGAVTGKVMTESEGWLFLQILKQVRLFSAKDMHMDSAVDNVCYGSLMAEARAAGR